MAEPFADEDYFHDNFGSPPDSIRDRLAEELARASRYVRRECPGIDAKISAYAIDPTAPGTLDPEVAADVVCEMVRAGAAGSAGGVGVQSLQQGAGPYQQTTNFSNPVGDLYLSKKQRRLLGYGGQQAFTIPMAQPAPRSPLGWIFGDEP